MLRGIDTPDHLIDFFLKKNHRYIVLYAADLLKMPLPSRATLLDLMYTLNMQEIPSGQVPPDGYRRRIQGLGLYGYIRIPVELLTKLTIEQVATLRDFLGEYKETRANEFKPVKEEKCECQGQKKQCNKCGGGGVIRILVEMSAVEEKLAMGADWNSLTTT